MSVWWTTDKKNQQQQHKQRIHRKKWILFIEWAHWRRHSHYVLLFVSVRHFVFVGACEWGSRNQKKKRKTKTARKRQYENVQFESTVFFCCLRLILHKRWRASGISFRSFAFFSIIDDIGVESSQVESLGRKQLHTHTQGTLVTIIDFFVHAKCILYSATENSGVVLCALILSVYFCLCILWHPSLSLILRIETDNENSRSQYTNTVCLVWFLVLIKSL